MVALHARQRQPQRLTLGKLTWRIEAGSATRSALYPPCHSPCRTRLGLVEDSCVSDPGSAGASIGSRPGNEPGMYEKGLAVKGLSDGIVLHGVQKALQPGSGL